MAEDGEARKSLLKKQEIELGLSGVRTHFGNKYLLPEEKCRLKIERGDRNASQPHLRTGRGTVSQPLPTRKDLAILQKPGGDHGLS